MRSEDVGGIIKEVAHGDDFGVCYFSKLFVSVFSLFGKRDVEFGSPDLILEDFKPLLSLFKLVMEEQPF